MSAFRREATDHETYAAWLAEVVGGADELALHDVVLSGMARIVTHPRIMATPAPVPTVLEFLGEASRRPARSLVTGGAGNLERVRPPRRRRSGILGNLVPDAHLAALAVAHGCRPATTDRGFGRFPGLDHFDPAA